eukprot:558277-Hanusia_phi.AAC.1
MKAGKQGAKGREGKGREGRREKKGGGKREGREGEGEGERENPSSAHLEHRSKLSSLSGDLTTS